ncbi:MAG: hypothetical protein COV59_01770 [Candidatus Magasanikbacteria bacterium CG11_big_fil_rev_8_21_14_0_20_39_34]|uniref:Uncharacterized protein n=1 Tax=Candidatus Magasanikbacteria bacterium CG11_big_fil_rev_8_21_14_0_20_39_34 TaxID=1974653 RepID=A0A2H0N6Z9_9BACT|nr:MAG: hypothetical protein COV59_01770 [Candidatus Magasanikbacteria bacterium CG11_big_fil_rev_8_21_14_0_20_39_34]
MFGKKKKNPSHEKEQTKVKARMFVIPEIFYGGKDPVIYKKQVTDDSKVLVDEKKEVKKEPEKKPEVKVEKPHPTPKPVKKEGIEKPPVRKKVSYKKWIIIAIVLLLGVLAAVYAFFIRGKGNTSIQEPEKSLPIQTEEVVSVVNTPENTNAVSTTTDQTEEVPTTTPSLEASVLEFPRILLADSIDLDKDGLTDKEEEVFDTDSGKKDTDDDGYSDGQEIRNLYNPKGFAPVKLIDSGLVEEYVSRNWGYQVYYPKTWKLGEVDYDGTQVLLSAIEGDYIEIRAFEKEKSESFQDWFAKNALGEKYSDIQEMETSFGVRGLIRKDKLVAYFYTPEQVFVFIYHPGVTNEIAYRLIMQMAIESFQPQDMGSTLPEQPVVPIEGEAVDDQIITTSSSNEQVFDSSSTSLDQITPAPTSTELLESTQNGRNESPSSTDSTEGGTSTSSNAQEFTDFNDLF